MTNLEIKSNVVKETEKAIAINICYINKFGEQVTTKWLPKSQIKVSDGSISIPKWIVKNIFNELSIGTYASFGETSLSKLDII